MYHYLHIRKNIQGTINKPPDILSCEGQTQGLGPTSATVAGGELIQDAPILPPIAPASPDSLPSLQPRHPHPRNTIHTSMYIYSKACMVIQSYHKTKYFFTNCIQSYPLTLIARKKQCATNVFKTNVFQKRFKVLRALLHAPFGARRHWRTGLSAF